MNTEIDIRLGAEVYGWLDSYKGLPFPAAIKDYFAYKKGQYQQGNELKTGSIQVKNLYGKPVVCPVTIGGITLGSGQAGNIWMQPMCVVEGAKRIVKTPIAGGSYRGTIKEFINFDDYRIRIHGFLVNFNKREYPVDQAQILKDLWQRNEALPFDCIITNDLFSHVVIEDMILDELNMAPGLQRYEISATSDGIMEVEELVVEKSYANAGS
jgi:hypothetical protein